MAHAVQNLSAAQIMDMIQRGYNSLNPNDIRNYLNRKPPATNESMNFFFGGKLKNNLGEGNINDSSDYGALKETFGADAGVGFKYENDQYTSNDSYKVLGPNGSYKDISKEFKQRMEAKSLNKKMGLQNLFEEESENEDEIKPSNKKNKITDNKKSGQIGYEKGVEYINEFIALLKNPNSKQRYSFFLKLKEVFEKESFFTEESIKYYKGGLNKAEKELMNKIKKTKNE